MVNNKKINSKLVSIIIVNWNGKEFLKDCLPSLYTQDYKNIEVIIVDNNSTDGSVAYIKKYFPETKIIINEANLGFAEGNNIGYGHATGDYVLFLNNDTKVTKNFLSELIKVLGSDRKIGGTQSKILLMDDPKRLDSVGAYLTPTGVLYHYALNKKDSPKYDKSIDIYSAKGACMMFKRKVLKEIEVDGEIFDSRYFAYFEETDMCHRVWLAGYRVVFAPKSIIYHKMGGTSTKMDNNFIQYHSFKNRMNSYCKNLEWISLVKIMTVHLIMCESYALLMLIEMRFRFFISIQKAIIWNIINLRTSWGKRLYIQKKIRLVSDEELLPQILRPVRLDYYFKLSTGLENYED